MSTNEGYEPLLEQPADNRDHAGLLLRTLNPGRGRKCQQALFTGARFARSYVYRSLSIPAEMDARIKQIALDTGTTPRVIVSKALSLYLVATEKKRLGLKLGFAKKSEQIDTEVVEL